MMSDRIECYISHNNEALEVILGLDTFEAKVLLDPRITHPYKHDPGLRNSWEPHVRQPTDQQGQAFDRSPRLRHPIAIAGPRSVISCRSASSIRPRRESRHYPPATRLLLIVHEKSTMLQRLVGDGQCSPCRYAGVVVLGMSPVVCRCSR